MSSSSPLSLLYPNQVALPLSLVADDASHFQLISLLFWLAGYAFVTCFEYAALDGANEWKKQVRRVISHLDEIECKWMHNGHFDMFIDRSAIGKRAIGIGHFPESDDNESISNVAHPMNCNSISVDRCTVFYFRFSIGRCVERRFTYTRTTHQNAYNYMLISIVLVTFARFNASAIVMCRVKCESTS